MVRGVAVIICTDTWSQETKGAIVFFHKVPWDLEVISSDRAIKWACNWTVNQCLQVIGL